MAKLYTLDEKLLTDAPEIRVKDKLYPVDNRQKTVRKLMQINTDQMDGSQVSEQMDQTPEAGPGRESLCGDRQDGPALSRLSEAVRAGDGGHDRRGGAGDGAAISAGKAQRPGLSGMTWNSTRC